MKQDRKQHIILILFVSVLLQLFLPTLYSIAIKYKRDTTVEYFAKSITAEEEEEEKSEGKSVKSIFDALEEDFIHSSFSIYWFNHLSIIVNTACKNNLLQVYGTITTPPPKS